MTGRLGHAGLLASSSSAPTLDAFTTNLWAAVSLRRLLTSHSGPIVNVRRSSDSTNQDIGANPDGTLDTFSLASFVGAGDGGVRVWYDQSGGGHDLGSSNTATREPTMVASGAYLGLASFDGSSDCLESGNSGTPSAFTVFFKGRFRSTSGLLIGFEQSANYNSNDACVIYKDSITLSCGIREVSPVENARRDVVYGLAATHVMAIRFDRTQATTDTKVKVFADGIPLTTTEGASGLPSGNFTANPWYIGARAAASLFADLDVSSVLIYEAAISDSDIAQISAVLA
jgi:hypothetical protein